MFCRNCGNEMPDGAEFCTSCGMKRDGENAVNSQNASNANDNAQNVSGANNNQQGSNYATQYPEEAPVATAVEENSQQGSLAENTPKIRKKMGKGKLIGIISACVATLVAVGFFVWRPLVYAMFPEYYVGNLIDNTFDEMLEDYNDIEENILGFNLESDKKLTVGGVLEVNEDYEYGNAFKLEGKMTNNPDSKELVGTGKISFTKVNGEKGKVAVEGQAFLNDKQIGAGFKMTGDEIPEAIKKVNGKDFVVPSKTFGKAFAESDIAKENEDALEREGIDIDKLKDLDLSYSNLFSKDGGNELEPLIDAYKDHFVEFLKKCDLSDRESVDFKMGEDEVSAKKISLKISQEAALELILDILQSTADDSYINEKLSDDDMDGLENAIDQIEEQLDGDLSNDELEIDIIEYDGRIVGIVISVEGEDWEIEISSTDKKHLLNGIEYKYDSGHGFKATIGFSANWVSEDEVIFAEFSAKDNNGYKVSAELEIDYTKGKFEAKLKDGDQVYKATGSCSKNGKFTAKLNEAKISNTYWGMGNSMTFEEWLDDEYYYSYEADDAYENYIYEEHRSDELYDIYWDSSYSKYIDWYVNEGEDYDPDYMSFYDWIHDVACNDESVYSEYDYETSEEVRIEYETSVKGSITISETADVKAKKNSQIKIFEKSMEELEDLFTVERTEKVSAREIPVTVEVDESDKSAVGGMKFDMKY